MFVCRSDRRMVVVLLSWSCTLFILLLVDEFALWYIALLVDFALYSLLYGSGEGKKEDEDEDEAEEGGEEGEEGEEGMEGEGEGEEGEADGTGSGFFDEQPSDPATKSQPATSRDSGRRASVMLTKLQL